MKRSTKKIIFIAAMLITNVGLFATVGRHCHHGCYTNQRRHECQTNECRTAEHPSWFNDENKTAPSTQK